MSAVDPPLVIAVDGPAASGKGTLAGRLARHYGLRHLDTGLLYRVVGLRIMRSNSTPPCISQAVAAAKDIDETDFSDPRLREEEVGQVASLVATHAPVRIALLDYQREFALTPPGAVLDGRDIGTVVCPDAQAKIFLEASTGIRAQRRLNELRSRGVKSIESRVLIEMRTRDTRDQRRDVAQLKPADDAHHIDTGALNADMVFERAVKFVNSRLL